MKILVISNMYPDIKHPSYGVFVKNFCDELQMINVDYRLSVMRKSDNFIGKVIRYLKFYVGTFFKCLFGDYDIYYVHYASHSAIPVLMANQIRKQQIYTNVHGSDVVPENNKQRKMQRFTKKLLGVSKKIIVPSVYFEKLVEQKYDIPHEKIEVFPSAGVDQNIFHTFNNEEIERIRCRYNIDSQKLVFGMAGRITTQKGWDTFLEAIKRNEENAQKAQFLIIGDGDESDKLEATIEKLDLNNKVIFIRNLIPQRELALFFAMIDWFVFPTRREGESLGLVAIEAMACGTPVIANDFAAPKYYIKDGINGYKFSNVEQLSQIIKNVIENNDKGLEFEDEVRMTVENFTQKNIIPILEKILLKNI